MKTQTSRSNYIPGTGTVTRSLSFDALVFKQLEKRRRELGMDRSTFIRAILEDYLLIRAHPEIQVDRDGEPWAGRRATANPEMVEALTTAMRAIFTERLPQDAREMSSLAAKAHRPHSA